MLGCWTRNLKLNDHSCRSKVGAFVVRSTYQSERSLLVAPLLIDEGLWTGSGFYCVEDIVVGQREVGQGDQLKATSTACMRKGHRTIRLNWFARHRTTSNQREKRKRTALIHGSKTKLNVPSNRRVINVRHEYVGFASAQLRPFPHLRLCMLVLAPMSPLHNI